ncbi:MAG: hypothetical protein ACRDO0_16115 [Nocardioidaceae bacterium]
MGDGAQVEVHGGRGGEDVVAVRRVREAGRRRVGHDQRAADVDVGVEGQGRTSATRLRVPDSATVAADIASTRSGSMAE